MSAYTKVNLKGDVKDMAPEHGMAPGMEARFARTNLEMSQGGMSYYRIAPGYRVPFGHTHSEQEEVYVVTSGAARIKIGDEVVELGTWDALRVAPGTWRGMEGGPDGCELLAFGAPDTGNGDAELAPGWWTD